VTINNDAGLFESGNCNENNLKPLTRINWRASLVPAAAVIPAPMAYIKVVAVKKLVVGFLAGATGRPFVVCTSVASGHICGERVWH
jgi:tetrahydromethanopterin S-methyltransferase subunit A